MANKTLADCPDAVRDWIEVGYQRFLKGKEVPVGKNSASHANGFRIDGLSIGHPQNGLAIDHLTCRATLVLHGDLEIQDLNRAFFSEQRNCRDSEGFVQFDLHTINPAVDDFSEQVAQEIIRLYRSIRART